MLSIKLAGIRKELAEIPACRQAGAFPAKAGSRLISNIGGKK